MSYEERAPNPAQVDGRQLDLLDDGKVTRRRSNVGRVQANRGGAMMVVDLKRESGHGLKLLARVEAKHPGDPLRQVDTFIEQLRFKAATGRDREPSIKTRKAYKDRLRMCVQDLATINMGIQNLSQLSARHAPKLVELWEAKGNSPAYMQNSLTALRRLMVWMGKPSAVPRLQHLVSDKSNAERPASAVRPKGLADKGITPDELFRRMDAKCTIAGLQLRLKLAFGLRVEEVVMLRPAIADMGSSLMVSFGTKGGRSRTVPVESYYQRDLIQRAKAIAAGNAKGILTDRPTRKFHSARNRFYYLCKVIGLTRKELGVTPHGLRHEYANLVYEQLTGELSPVMGGPRLDKEVEDAARLEVSQRLGHGRVSVTSAYLGSHRAMDRHHRQQLLTLAAIFEAEDVRAAIAGAGITRLLIVGDPAEGKEIGRVASFGWEGHEPEIPHSMNTALTDVLRRALGGRLITFAPIEYVTAEIPTFEVF